jgi:hypothetical protein
MAKEVIVFTGTEPYEEDEEIELLDEGGGTRFPVETVGRNLREFMDSLNEMMPDLAPGTAQYPLDKITVAVGINGTGKVGFLGTGAKAGASATLTLEFKHSDTIST